MLSWSVMASMVGCTITMYLFVRYAVMLGLSWWISVPLFIFLILIGCTQPLTTYAFEEPLGKFYPFYRYTIYFLFIGCVILMCLTLAADALWFVAYKLKWLSMMPVEKGVCAKFHIGLLLTALALTVYALYAGIKVPDIRETTIVSDKIKRDRKVVVLSDIHIHRVVNPDKVRRIVERVNALEPDVILLVGDIVDDDMPRIAETVGLLKDLKAKEGVYFVSGNHEFYAGYRDSLVTMQKFGFKTLENDGENLGDLFVAGIPDPRTAWRVGLLLRPDVALREATDKQFRILMSHTPINFGKDNNFDLAVSGHTHGGQIFPFHLLVSWVNKYLSGLYDIGNNAQIYVSNGAGQWGPQMRLLAPSEISLIHLTSQPTKGEK